MNKINLLITFCFLLLATAQSFAQQSLTFQLAPKTVTAAVGDEIDIEVRVGTGFTDLIGVQFGLNFNGAALEYISADNSSNPLSPNYSLVKLPNKSEILNVWTDIFNPTPITLAPGTLLYTAKFRVLSTIGNSIDILCGGDNVACEFSDPALMKFDDISVDCTADINGGGPSENAGPINITIGNETTSTSSQVCVPFAVSDFVDIFSMQFSIQYDESLLLFTGILQNQSNCPGVLPPSTVSNPLCIDGGNFNLFEPGTLTFTFSDLFNGNSFTLDDGTVIFDLCFDAIGAGGTSSDIVIDGDPTFIQVTKDGEGNENFGLTSNVGSVTISGSGGPLEVVSYTIGNAGGDTGTNVCVPVTVDDGFDDILGFGWSVNYDPSILSYTGIQNTNPALNAIGASEDSPGVLSFIWTAGFMQNSEISLADGSVLYEMCFDVIGSSGQVSTLEFADFPNPVETVKTDGPDADNEQDLMLVNTTNGNVTVTNSDGFNLIFCEADVCQGDQICIPLLGTGVVEVAALSFTVAYDVNVLDYTGLSANTVPFFGANEPPTNEGNINVVYINLAQPPAPNSLSLEDCETIAEFCFDVVGGQGTSSAIEITSDPVEFKASTIGDNGVGEEIEVAATNGAINVDCSGTAGEPVVACECGAGELMVDADGSDVNDISCSGEEDGSIILNVSGGEMPITYAWSNGETTKDIEDLGPGNYSVDVSDASGAMINASFTILEPSAISQNSTATNTSSLGANDGSIVLNVSGGTSPYSYSWSNGETTAMIQDLAPNTYNVTITDDNGCELITSRTIGEKLTIGPSGGPGSPAGTTILTDVACFGDNSGSIELALTGGVAPLSISWDNGSDQSLLTGLAAGNYCVTITDTNGDQVEGCYDITGPMAPIDITGALTSQTLSGANDGSIVLTVTGGDMPYTYNWNGQSVNGVTTKDINNLGEGSYIVDVTDARGCVASRTFFIDTDGEPLTINTGATQITDVICFGENTGAIELALAGGEMPLTISWNFGSNQASVFGLAAGNYCVTVMDADGDQVDACFDVSGPSSAINVSETIVQQSLPGTNDGSISLATSGGSSPYTYSWTGPGVNGVTTQDISALTEGTYIVNVTDAIGCTITRNFFVSTAGEALSINPNTTQVANESCFGANDGAINPSVNGGVAPYIFSWSGPNGYTAATGPIGGLEPGSYQLTVTDNAGTVAISVPFLVSGPSAALSVTGQIIEESAPGQNDGGVNLTVAGGTPGYSFTWSNGFFTEDIFGLTMGTYTVTVNDTRGCTIIESFNVTSDADPLVINAQGSTINNVRCFGDSNGSISPVVNGGFPPYSYDWGAQGTTETISGLAAGEYTLTVTDQNGLTDIQTFLVQSPSQLEIVVGPVVPESANGNDGGIQVTVTGGTPGYSYSWVSTTGFTSNSEDITNLTEGTYTLTVVDANGCTMQRVVVLGAVLNIENKFEIDVDCFGECTGEIDIVVVGGQPPYLYNWAGPDGFLASTQDLSDLCAGVYTATISDAAGQQVFSTCRIDEPLLALSIANNPTIIDEVVPNAGSINITVNGGTPPYDYQWSNEEESEDITNLSADAYRVTVTDANGCIVISNDYIVERIPLPINIENITVSDPTCNGDCNGAISFQILGGDAPYTVTWNDLGSETLSSTNPNYSREDMCAGDYDLTIVDANGQEFPSSFTLEDLPEIIIDGQVTAEINGNDGTINTTITGGQAPFTYEWAPSTLPDTPDQENLSAGLYIVTVTDANECTAIESFVIENQIGPLTILPNEIINQIDCFGDMNGSIDITVNGGVQPYNFLWSSNNQVTEDAIGLGAGSYTVTVTDANGSQVEGGEYVIVEPAQITATLEDVLPADSETDCNGSATLSDITGGQAPYSILWLSGEIAETAIELCAGVQNVTITDALGCAREIEFEIEIDNSLNALSFAADITDVECNGDATGAISLEVFGGFAPYNYVWSTGEETPNIGNLLPGTYGVTISDEAGNEIITDFEVEEPDAMTTTFETTPETGMGSGDGTATVFVEGGVPPYSYQWNDPGACITAQCTDLTAGTYFVVIQDSNECIKVDSVVVENSFGGECNMTRNIITPNDDGSGGDGKNDTFIIQCAPGTINTLEIYNRWGQLVFTTDNYDNTWAGTDRRGNDLPAGGYFYVFLLEDSTTGETVPYKGHITILRQ